MATLEDRVASGIKFLDLTTPGWRDRVDLDDLHMENCGTCILGQVFGNYIRALPLLERAGWDGMPDEMMSPEMLGFEGGQDPEIPWRRGYDELGAEWKRQLTATA